MNLMLKIYQCISTGRFRYTYMISKYVFHLIHFIYVIGLFSAANKKKQKRKRQKTKGNRSESETERKEKPSKKKKNG